MDLLRIPERIIRTGSAGVPNPDMFVKQCLGYSANRLNDKIHFGGLSLLARFRFWFKHALKRKPRINLHFAVSKLAADGSSPQRPPSLFGLSLLPMPDLASSSSFLSAS